MCGNKGCLIEHRKAASLKINKSIQETPGVDTFPQAFPSRKSPLSSRKMEVTLFSNIFGFVLSEQAGLVNALLYSSVSLLLAEVQT